MSWGLLAVSIVAVFLTVNAFSPLRREPFTVISFALGWIPGELPIQVMLVEAIVVLILAREGALHHWTGWVGLALTAASWAGLIRLAFVAREAKGLVDTALAEATMGPVDVEGFDSSPAWNYWWRLAIAVPFRWRAIRRIRNIDYWGDGLGRHRLDILQPRGGPPQPGPVLVYIHGGAWVIGDKRQQGIPMMHELIQRGWVCVAINYRLSPKATWPDHIVDCKRAVAWVRAHIAEYGGDPSFIAVSGGSAGGHLSALVALTPDDPDWQPGFEDADTSVDACIPYYGVYDMTGDPEQSGAYGPGLLELLEEKVMKLPIEGNRPVFEQASPTCRVTSSAPPMFVFHGVNDTLVPLEVARRFVQRLREVSGSPVGYVELPRTQHAFDVLASIRCRHTTIGAVRFLEGMRSRVDR
ncbi:MAG TPA: alpha/beta hydrolase [Acidimicrobiales bacterium]|nr:alpha/beta hydrolase [Acidimicrobiales bacterium]